MRRGRPVKVICGLLGGDPDLLRRTVQLLQREFGPIDGESPVWPFDQTDYYEDEMGPDLSRLWISFAEPGDPGRLADWKRQSIALERRLAEECLTEPNRPVNIDPGYIGLNKLVLATTKDAGHRVYLGGGLYAEVTLQYRDGGWAVQPWTYPDYAAGAARGWFVEVRDRYLAQLSA